MLKKYNKKGLTLIEVLLYVGFMAIIFPVIGSFFISAIKIHMRNNDAAAVEREGNRIIQIVTQIIRNADKIQTPYLGETSSTLVLSVFNSATTTSATAIGFGETTTSTGPNNGSSFVNDASVGTIAWSAPSNAANSDNSYSVASLGGFFISHYLKAANFNFSIPANAAIRGIKAEVERYKSMGTVIDNSVKVVKGGAIGGNEKASAGDWPTSDAYAGYGGPTDLWGLSWLPADINNSNFGFVISARGNAMETNFAQIDHMRITVYYSISGASFQITEGANLPNIILTPDVVLSDLQFSNTSRGGTPGSVKMKFTLAKGLYSKTFYVSASLRKH